MLKGKKTVIFAVLTFGIAIAGYFGFGDFVMPEAFKEIYDVVLPLAFLVLRYITTSEIFKSE